MAHKSWIAHPTYGGVGPSQKHTIHIQGLEATLYVRHQDTKDIQRSDWVLLCPSLWPAGEIWVSNHEFVSITRAREIAENLMRARLKWWLEALS